MPNPIVTVQVSQQVAPTPDMLQKTGALISQGGTTLISGTTALLTQYSDLAPWLPTAGISINNAVWNAAFGGQVTATTATNLGVATGAFFDAVITGMTPSAYNGSFKAEATAANSFTYYLAPNPGPMVSAGSVLQPASAELQSMALTFFSQSGAQSVYVLELGAGSVASGVQALQNYIATTDTQFFYSYLTPREWDADPNFLAMLATFESDTSKTYFFVTTTLNTYQLYTPQMKDVVAMVEAPAYSGWPANILSATTWASGQVTATTTTPHNVKPGDWITIVGSVPAGYNGSFKALAGTTGSTLVYALATNPGTITTEGSLQARVGTSAGRQAGEFSHAADFYVALNYAPSATNKVSPFAFSFLNDVTPFPTFGNSALISTLKTGNINYVSTGAEGGISDTMLVWGHTMDGRPFNYWYSVDWMQITVDQAVANAVINGSNIPANPLYYDQNGIDRLENVAASVGAQGVSFGLAVGRVVQLGLDDVTFNTNLNNELYAGNVVINAIPFATYVRANPGDYKVGKYAGLTMVYTPQRGFEAIVFNIVVTDFVTA
jgi:hypothetical protein